MAINEFMAHFEGKQVLPPLLPNVSADCGADDNPHLAAARTSDQREREKRASWLVSYFLGFFMRQKKQFPPCKIASI